jgi:hypothetical protein
MKNTVLLLAFLDSGICYDVCSLNRRGKRWLGQEKF